jgi:hypothetical protein
MNGVDAILFGLLAVGDLSLLVHLRRRRARHLRQDRMARALRYAVEREIELAEARPYRLFQLRRAG